MVALIVIDLIASGCASGGDVLVPGSQAGSKSLTGAGATFPAPLYQLWAEKYRQVTGVKVNYQAIGSGGGIQQITARTVDYGASDAPMKDDELAEAPGPILHIPIVFGGVVVTYNLSGVASGLRLTPDAVAGVFLGRIKRWNDPAIASLNAGAVLPASEISVVHRSDGSGTTNIFTAYLSDVSEEWKTEAGSGKEVEWPTGVGGKGNDGVAALVKQLPGSLGYVELAYAQQNGMPTAALRNQAGSFMMSDLASITAAAATVAVPEDLRFSVVNAPGADAYPIVGATWLLVYREQADRAKATTLVNFLWWAVHDGQRYAEPLLYATLPTSLVMKVEAKIRSIAFRGAPLGIR